MSSGSCYPLPVVTTWLLLPFFAFHQLGDHTPPLCHAFSTASVFHHCRSLPHQQVMPLQYPEDPEFASSSTTLFAGFGGGGTGGGFGSSSKNKKKNATKVKPPSQKQIIKQLTKTYGGTTSEEIALGTQRLIDKKMKSLDEPIQLALRLYQQLQQWNFRIQGLSLDEQMKVFGPEDIQGAKDAEKELNRMLEDLDLQPKDIHNLWQVMTWDASADAKAARSVTGKMPRDIQRRLEQASDIVAEALQSEDDMCLDVGCGFGVMVPFLTKAGITSNQIYGIDLSPEMIRNAQRLHGDEINFVAGDYFQYEPDHEKFAAIIFCSALHDMPDVMGAIKKSISLLGDGGKIVILHAQGASHVLDQVKSNPVMVPRGLPTTSELKSLNGVKVLVEPAAAKSKEESRDGYLAVLERI